MAKKTQSATGQQVQAEQPKQQVQAEQPEHKLPAGTQAGERTRAGRTFRPRVDICETERGLVLLADVAGAKPDGLTITLDRRVLNVHAQAGGLQPSLPGISSRRFRMRLHAVGRLRRREDRGEPDEWCAPGDNPQS
jgi:HSP20 family molecular chaperone IbpA